MIKFIKRILFSLSVLLLIDTLIIGNYIDYLPNKEVDKRLQYVLEGKINKDVIIVGSSRGARNIIASDLEKNTGKTCYNLSFPGSDVTFHEFIIKTLLKFNDPPDYIVLTIDGLHQLTPSSSIKFRFDRLYPLINYDYIVEELIKKREISSSARYVNTLRLKRSQYDFRQRVFGELDSLLDCGSMPINFQDKRLDTIYYSSKETLYSEYIGEESKQKIDALLSINEILMEQGVGLVIVFPPNLHPDPIGLEERIVNMLNLNGVITVPENDSIYKNPIYYYDGGHLQKNGAHHYTNYLAKELNLIYQMSNKPANISADRFYLKQSESQSY